MSNYVERQRFRDATGRRQKTLHLDEVGDWQVQEPVPKTDPALEAAMRPFLSDLTVKERQAVSVFFADERPDERTAAHRLGIAKSVLRRRLYGGDRKRGSLTKVRESLLAALPDEVRRGLEEDHATEHGGDPKRCARCLHAYYELRKWLTPAENIRPDGTEDPWIVADCLVCGRTCAHWRPATIRETEARGQSRYEEPRLICMSHLN